MTDAATTWQETTQLVKELNRSLRGWAQRVLAYRRSNTLRRVDRPSESRRDIVDSRLRVDQSIPKRDAGVEKTKLVTAQQASTRLEQLVQYLRDRTERPK